jgi:hypothetical protein
VLNLMLEEICLARIEYTEECHSESGHYPDPLTSVVTEQLYSSVPLQTQYRRDGAAHREIRPGCRPVTPRRSRVTSTGSKNVARVSAHSPDRNFSQGSLLRTNADREDIASRCVRPGIPVFHLDFRTIVAAVAASRRDDLHARISAVRPRSDSAVLSGPWQIDMPLVLDLRLGVVAARHTFLPVCQTLTQLVVRTKTGHLSSWRTQPADSAWLWGPGRPRSRKPGHLEP